MVEQGAAPAVDPRKIGTGRPRVTVLANYVAAPFSGLVGTGGSEAKAERSRGGRSTHPVLKATVPRSEIAAVECRKATRSPVRERALPSSREGAKEGTETWRLSALRLPRVGVAARAGRTQRKPEPNWEWAAGGKRRADRGDVFAGDQGDDEIEQEESRAQGGGSGRACGAARTALRPGALRVACAFGCDADGRAKDVRRGALPAHPPLPRCEHATRARWSAAYTGGRCGIHGDAAAGDPRRPAPPRLGVMLHVPERRLAEIKRKQGGA